MAVEVLNFKFTGLYFVMFFFCAVADKNKEPVLEVVSVYNDNFTTPNSREPYFIEVYRCVDGHGVECGDGHIAVQDSYEKIGIFVPDLNNRTKFYKYVVYSHISCKCGGLNDERKLYNETVQEVNKTIFQNGSQNNPVNLRKKCGFCEKPKPRYRQHTDFKLLHPQTRYYLQYQCLPGCINESEVNVTDVIKPGRVQEKRNFTNDKSCTPYKSSHEPPSRCNCTNHNTKESTKAEQKLLDTKKSSNDNESSDKLIISISSARLFLAALMLSFVLLIILVWDLGLCRGKKGMLYALCICTGSNNDDDFSRNNNERRINEVTV